jgi:UDPglucose 6-dehydrogenase
VIPGYVHQVATYLIKDCENTSISYNPEFIAQGDIVNGLIKPDVVLIGQGSQEAGDRLEFLYRKMCENDAPVRRMSAERCDVTDCSETYSAEITKLSVNCFVTTKIAFANFIGDVADRTPGANKNDILNAVGSDSRVGLKVALIPSSL